MQDGLKAYIKEVKEPLIKSIFTGLWWLIKLILKAQKFEATIKSEIP